MSYLLANAVLAADQYHVESPLLQNPGKRTSLRRDRKRVRGIAPAKSNCCVRALFVGVGRTVVFVEREFAVSAGIDSQLNWIGWVLGGPLQLRPHRDNGARAHVERHDLQRRSGGYDLAAFERGASPEVVPGCACR